MSGPDPASHRSIGAMPGSRATIAAGVAGWAGMVVGLGLARFAYTPLLPALISAGWFSPGGAAAQGAANLAGYLGGAALAWPLARRLPLRPVLRGAMLLAALSLAACAAHPPPLAFALARALAGAAGGIIMVLGPPSVIAAVPAALRGRVGGVVFAGVGSGIAGSALAVPPLLAHGLAVTWIALGMAALLLALLAWPLWPPAPPTTPAPAQRAPGLARLVAGYAVNGAAIAPHMLMLADFIARGLGAGISAGALGFAVYGMGAIAGPLLGGLAADRFGFRRTLPAALAIQAVAIAAPALFPSLPVAVASGLVVGAFTPGIPPLVLGRAVELAGPEAARRAWPGATIGYGIFQAGGAWAVAGAFTLTGLYWPLFAGGALAALTSLWLARAPRGA